MMLRQISDFILRHDFYLEVSSNQVQQWLEHQPHQ